MKNCECKIKQIQIKSWMKIKKNIKTILKIQEIIHEITRKLNAIQT